MTGPMENIAILGASRGLGLELAKHLRQTEQLFLAARNVESLKAEFSAPHMVQSFDFTRDSQWDELFLQLKSHKVRRIIYCAGGGPYGEYEKKAWKDHPNYFEIQSKDSFLEKVDETFQIIKKFMPECCKQHFDISKEK